MKSADRVRNEIQRNPVGEPSGQHPGETQVPCAARRKSKGRVEVEAQSAAALRTSGQTIDETQRKVARSPGQEVDDARGSRAEGDGADLVIGETQAGPVGGGADLGPYPAETRTDHAQIRVTIARIIELGRENAFAIRQRMRVRQSTLSHIARAYFDYHTRLPEAERKKCMDAAAKVLKSVKDGETHEAAGLVHATDAAAAPWEAIERESEKQLVKLARTLPAYEWAQSVRGFGDLSFARIIAETGDLSGYANPAKVWKRMGLAVFDGKAQRKVRDQEKAKEQGYNPYRRAVAFVAFEPVLKAQSAPKNGDQNRNATPASGVAEADEAGHDGNETHANVAGPYRQLYDRKKAEYLARGEAGEEEWKTKAHCHKAAMRYASKRLLRDLWIEWNKSPTSQPVKQVSVETRN